MPVRQYRFHLCIGRRLPGAARASVRRGLAGLPRETLPILREARADRYGIRAVHGDVSAPVKFEIVREARIIVDAGLGDIAGVPMLCRDSQYAEKLLANADRGLERSTFHRDLIDLLMITRWGPSWVVSCCPDRTAILVARIIGCLPRKRMVEKNCY